MSDSCKESDILYEEMRMKRSEKRRKFQLRVMFLVLLLLLLPYGLYGQQIGTNVSWWLTSTPNAEVEFMLSKRLTLNVSDSYNSCTFFPEGMTLRHYLVQPELRYWPCKSFEGHFFGVHGHYGHYNIGQVPFIPGLKDYTYRGELYGGGFSYGYHFAIGGRWGLELSLGVGYAYLEYNKYVCTECAELVGGVLSFLLLACLFLFSQSVFSQTGNILFTPETLVIHDDSVRIGMNIIVRNIQIPTDHSLKLIPYFQRDNKHVSLPPVILSGRQRSRFDRREELIAPHSFKEKTYIRLIGIKEKDTYTIHYNISLPYAGWMRHASLCLKQVERDCCKETLLSDTLLTKDINLPDPCTGLEEKGGEP